MKNPICLALCALALAASPAFAQLQKDEYKSEKKEIAATAKADKKSCHAMEKNARKVCEADVKARQKVARAELDDSVKQSGRSSAKARRARANATYEVAMQKCEAFKGPQERQCKRDARAAHDLATTGSSAPRERRS